MLIVVVVVRSIASRLGSACPRCGGETGRVVEALPYRHWYCPLCNVEWDDEVQKAVKSGVTWQV
jgi:transposase-like protein